MVPPNKERKERKVDQPHLLGLSSYVQLAFGKASAIYEMVEVKDFFSLKRGKHN